MTPRNGFRPRGCPFHRPPSAAPHRPPYRPAWSRARHGPATPGWPRRSPPAESRCVAKEWRSAWGVAVAGRPSCSRAVSIARAMRAGVERTAGARHGTGLVRRGLEWRECHITRHRLARRGMTGTMRVLPPLPVMRNVAGRGWEAPVRPSASEMRSPAAEEQREHRHVARRDPADRAAPPRVDHVARCHPRTAGAAACGDTWGPRAERMAVASASRVRPASR